MNCFYWNIRGIGNTDTRVTLRNLFLSHKPLLLFIAEPMVTIDKIPAWFWKSIGVCNFSINDRSPLIPNLWALWGTEVNHTIIFMSSQCIAMEVFYLQSSFYIAAIYASTLYLSRRDLWADLTYIQGRYQGPWLFIGDFNAVLGAHEKRGRRPPPPLSCSDFLQWSNANLLIHLPTMGPFLTWLNGRLGADSIALRLDRAICNDIWLNFWRRANCNSLIRHHSHHHPLLLSIDAMGTKIAIPFKFFKTWTSHVDCRRLVVDTLSKNVRGFGMLRLQLKLKNLKVVFKHWNRTIFGDVDRQVRLAVDEVHRIQHLIDTLGITAQLYAQDLEAQLLLTKALNAQDQLWKEKARE